MGDHKKHPYTVLCASCCNHSKSTKMEEKKKITAQPPPGSLVRPPSRLPHSSPSADAGPSVHHGVLA